MGNSNLLKLFFGFSILYFVTRVLDINLVANIAKASLIPIVFFNYYFSKAKVDIVPVVILLFCFLGDLFTLHLTPFTTRAFLVSYGLSYLILAIACFCTIRDFDVKKLIFSAVPVIILWFIYFNYSIKDIFGEQMGDLYPFIIVYSIVLSSFTIIALVNYFNNEQKINLYPVLISVSFLLADIMTAIHNFIVPLFFYTVTVVVLKVICYFFLMRFINTFEFKRLY
ncbi:lysoplasmalogenase family protein [Galbibacter mesophilus]|uniref:lysoplasmalogenase family protein n=1 Tax=Galbibacter mesophilus TaxID=379069 RepID=UPI00191E288A|nr:lysoplasmalogenase family protein [Galbibacter mesophilus]MCM5662767.1 lysoplasmalogenase family protein [Galbibacter mesophilus]